MNKLVRIAGAVFVVGVLVALAVIGLLHWGLAAHAGAGEALPPTIDLNSTSADLTVYGDDGGDVSGSSVATGDITGNDASWHGTPHECRSAEGGG